MSRQLCYRARLWSLGHYNLALLQRTRHGTYKQQGMPHMFILALASVLLQKSVHRHDHHQRRRPITDIAPSLVHSLTCTLSLSFGNQASATHSW